MFPATHSDPAERSARLIEGLCRAIAARSPAAGLALPLLVLAWSWLRRTTARLERLAQHFRTGKLGTSRAHRRRPAARHPQAATPPGRPKRLPRGLAWLVRLVPDARYSASQLQHLLQDPDMAALIAAAPQAGRLLRPLCRMLGIDHAPLRLPKRPRPPRATARSPGLADGPSPPAASPPAAPAPPRRPTLAWLRRTGLPGRRRPCPMPIQA